MAFTIDYLSGSATKCIECKQNIERLMFNWLDLLLYKPCELVLALIRYARQIHTFRSTCSGPCETRFMFGNTGDLR